MGNCLVLGDQVIKVVKPDGKILEYRSPITALDITSKFSGHEVSETVATARSSQEFLQPEAKLRGGNMYYLVALKPQDQGGSVKSKKKVRFSEPEKEYLVKEDEKEEQSKVVRIKVVISKKELQELLRKGGVSSISDMVTQLQNSDEKRIESSENICDDHDHHICDNHDCNRIVCIKNCI